MISLSLSLSLSHKQTYWYMCVYVSNKVSPKTWCLIIPCVLSLLVYWADLNVVRGKTSFKKSIYEDYAAPFFQRDIDGYLENGH